MTAFVEFKSVVGNSVDSMVALANDAGADGWTMVSWVYVPESNVQTVAGHRWTSEHYVAVMQKVNS